MHLDEIGKRYRVRHRTSKRTVATLVAQAGLIFVMGVVPAAAAGRAVTAVPTRAVLLPRGSRFICEMVDEGEAGASAWVYCWEYRGRSVGRHVRLDPESGVSLTVTEPRPTGLGGPGEPYGAWVTIGRFRCEVLKQGVECVVVATGHGFLAKADEIVEVQSEPGVAEPDPVMGSSVTAQTASGIVTIRELGSRYASFLNTGVRIPTGTVIDTTRGAVRLGSAAGNTGGTQTGVFSGGLFRVAQPVERSVGYGEPEDLTVLTLAGRLPKRCGQVAARPRGFLAARQGPAGHWRLWGSAQGDFQIRGHDASATVTGAKWLVEDSCDGTLVKVERGVVSIDDFLRHQTATVTEGNSYFAHPGPSGPGSSNGTLSHALIWRALNGKVVCGVVSHPANTSARTLLCMSRSVPPPKHTTSAEGDPGFVFLRATGRPLPTRLSQYSFQAENGWLPKNQAALQPGQKWSYGRIGVTCAVTATKVRCVNRSHHGFTITKTSYRGL